jgi:hypothetical protein
MHENKENGKKYIGITQQSLKKRSNNGKGYTGCTKFYNAIQKYGWENFKHKILFKGLTKEEAELKEQELIKEYNTQIDGYNIANGGKVNSITEETKNKMVRSHMVRQFKVVLRFPNGSARVFENLDEAAEKTKLDKKYIRGCCEGTIPTNKLDFKFLE